MVRRQPGVRAHPREQHEHETETRHAEFHAHQDEEIVSVQAADPAEASDHSLELVEAVTDRVAGDCFESRLPLTDSIGNTWFEALLQPFGPQRLFDYRRFEATH